MHSHVGHYLHYLLLHFVLILVVMEDALAQWDCRYHNDKNGVLILVVMEDALALFEVYSRKRP